MSRYGPLRAEWGERVGRRSDLGAALGFWTPILDGWAEWPGGVSPPLAWNAAECGDRWRRGVPLLAEAKPDIAREPLEALLGPLIERLAVAGPAEMAALRRFAEGWDAGACGPADLLPAAGKAGPPLLGERLDIPAHLLGFLAHAGLRPALEAHLASVRYVPPDAWPGVACPWCGGAPACAEMDEDGRRRLACHLCGGAWVSAGRGCVFCATAERGAVVALLEGEIEAGYLVQGCRACQRYLKAVDRRRRKDAGSPLVEDWGTPHLDLRAAELGYRRPTPSLAQLVP